MIMVTLSILQGPVILQVYAEPLFARTMPDMPSIVGTSLLAVIGIVGGTGGGLLIEKFGRRVSSLPFKSGTFSVTCVLKDILITVTSGIPVVTLSSTINGTIGHIFTVDGEVGRGSSEG